MAAIAHVVQGLEGIHPGVGFHRDIKPDNLLVTVSNGQFLVKVADFGLARLPSLHSSMTNNTMGTHPYMAPELHGGAGVTQASDIYSLGVTTLELLTGIRNADALSQGSFPQRIKSLVYAMIEPAPSKRPSIHNIAAELNTILNPPAQAVQRPPAVQPKQEEVGFGQALLAGGLMVGGIAALLALLAGGNNAEWDDNVGRNRGPDGRFKR